MKIKTKHGEQQLIAIVVSEDESIYKEINDFKDFSDLKITEQINNSNICEFTTKIICNQFNIFEWLDCYFYLFVDDNMVFAGKMEQPEIDFANGIANFRAVMDLEKELLDNLATLPNKLPEAIKNVCESDLDILNKWIDGYAGDVLYHPMFGLQFVDWLDILPNPHMKVIQNCDILKDGFSFTIEKSNFTNTVEVDLQFKTPVYWERKLHCRYSNGYEGTTINGFFDFIRQHNFIPAPPVDSVLSAINQAGWWISGFGYTGLPAKGIYNGLVWNPNPKTCTKTETVQEMDGQSVVRCVEYSEFNGQKYYAMQAGWDISKRWTQWQVHNVSGNVKLSKSVEKIGERKENFKFSITLPNEFENWGECKTNENLQTTASNGDKYKLNMVSQQDFNSVLEYVLHCANKIILNSQKNLKLNFGTFADFSISPLDIIEIDAIQGIFQIFEITQKITKFNLEGGMSISEFEAKGCYDFGDEYSDTGFYNIETDYRENPLGNPYEFNGRYGNTIINDAETTTQMMISNIQNKNDCNSSSQSENQHGFVMSSQNGMHAVSFSVETPEIESESTSDIERNASFSANMKIMSSKWKLN